MLASIVEMSGRLDLRLVLLTCLASANACIAGPQPEPPDDPEPPNGAAPDGEWLWPGEGRSSEPDDDFNTPPPPPGPPSAYADGGAAAPDAGAGGTPDPAAPWADEDGQSPGLHGDVAPFPFEPCCGWFRLPGEDAGSDAGDAGPDGGTSD